MVCLVLSLLRLLPRCTLTHSHVLFPSSLSLSRVLSLVSTRFNPAHYKEKRRIRKHYEERKTQKATMRPIVGDPSSVLGGSFFSFVIFRPSLRGHSLSFCLRYVAKRGVPSDCPRGVLLRSFSYVRQSTSLQLAIAAAALCTKPAIS